ncbi:Maltodextrin phosphorylase [Caprobacter fermentans]|uniref:Alpha-1,4 glucan phosphorylase n=1 Tax=Caproicibacter fermentans TaxID=2576756 RepID=A0A6N8I404_9FIRM|nr:glycogen/starch/alpha-glucan phosphorylase [Caproicibacter fermentans]MVB12688.1 Maltodextrin phosphorylase [Caproicibacter fermentans]
MKKSSLAEDLNRELLAQCGCSIAGAKPFELHNALTKCLMNRIAPAWAESKKIYQEQKRAYYFSAEFLVGRLIFNNLLALGMTEEVRQVLRENGSDLNSLEEIEDAALGNGGLGRLAACFLDSAATLGYPLDGYGIRYRYGLFRQGLKDGFQTETADDWTRFGDPWSIRKDRDAADVDFGDFSVRAVPYDMPVIGYGGRRINTLRLWQSEPVEGFDFSKFNDQDYDGAVEGKNRAEDLSRVLYPNDSTDEGKLLRIRQQYFFCSASVQDLLRRFVERYGEDFTRLPEFTAIQLNDTHPTSAVCELVRILCEEHGMDFEPAFQTAQKTFRYTNHTVMAEALETWDLELYEKAVPRVCAVLRRIDEYQKKSFLAAGGAAAKNLKACGVIRDGAAHMANLAIYGSCAVNGVAELHTEILKNSVLKEWNEISPGLIRNETNGITQRRWLALCNPELSALVTRLLGTKDWVTDLNLLSRLERFADDPAVLEQFAAVKREKKRQLSDYILKKESVSIPDDFLFDIQVKRLHEYKRQFLNALSILDLYFGIKDGSLKSFTPTAFLFGAKAAPGYARAKGIIKLINEIARLVDSDPAVRDLIRVVFVQNYNVSYAEKLVCAADLSEQISTAGTEASGTGNMKFMLNGTPTLGTYDGANIEIVRESGFENNYIFGARVEELDRIRESYDPKALLKNNPNAKRALDALTDGTLDDGGCGIFKELSDSLLEGASWHRPDQYFLLYDFDSYREARLRANSDYLDQAAFARKEFMNLVHSGKFSSDRTVTGYAEEIWQVQKT